MRNAFPFMIGMMEAFEKNLFTMTAQKENAVVSIFLDWFNKEAQLKPIPDLQQRIINLVPKLRKMARNLSFEFKEGKLVIKSDADSQSLLDLLRRGSDWFEPHPDVNAAILVALTSGSQVS